MFKYTQQEATHMLLDDEILDTLHGKLWRLWHQLWKHAERKQQTPTILAINFTLRQADLWSAITTIILYNLILRVNNCNQKGQTDYHTETYITTIIKNGAQKFH